jgi:hypothetical protein
MAINDSLKDSKTLQDTSTILESASDTSALAVSLNEGKMPVRLDANSAVLGIVPRSVEEAITVAKAFAMSGLFPDIKNAGQALAKILAGAEYGYGPAASMNAFHIVQGRLQQAGISVATQIKRHPFYNFRVISKSRQECTIAFFDSGEEVHRETFALEDAKIQGTQNMAKHADDMMWNRALTKGAKACMSDVFMGCSFVEGEEIHEQSAIPTTGPGSSRVKALLEARKPKAEPAIDAESEDVPFEHEVSGGGQGTLVE